MLKPQVERCSKFQAFAITVFGPEFLNKAYLKMRLDHLSATHVCMAYKYNEEGLNSPSLHGSCHDGEYLADIRLLDTLLKAKINNAAVFVVRRYSGVHIGGKRLTLIQQTAQEALDKLRESRGDILSDPESSADEADAESTISSQLGHSIQDPDGEGATPSKKQRKCQQRNENHGGGYGGRGNHGGNCGGGCSGGEANTTSTKCLNNPVLQFEYV